MERVDTQNKRMIVLPEGCFCGNCMECIYADRSDWNGDKVYCRCQKGWTHGYNRPEERNYVQPLQPFDSIVFDVEQLTAWGEYYILNRPMVTNQACIHTLLQPSLEIKGSVRNINS